MPVWQRRAFASLPLLVALIALAAAPSTCTGVQDATTKVTRGRLTARTHDLLRGMGNARRMRGAVVPKRFLYVYEMPPEFTTDLEALPVQWHPEQYDFDQVCTAMPPWIALCLTGATCTPNAAMRQGPMPCGGWHQGVFPHMDVGACLPVASSSTPPLHLVTGVSGVAH